MGITKTDGFSEEQMRLANLAKVLGHPARIAIVQHLIKVNKCVNGDIVDELPLSQSTVSQHLKELKQAGLIKGEIEGNSICYCINPEAWGTLSTIFNGLFESYNSCTTDGTCC